MPLVPQFRAEAPPGPQAPTLQRENRTRVDAGEALRGLGVMSGILRRGAPQMRNVDPNLGQATGQGIQAVGAGLRDVGDATYEIEKRAAEIRNRYALFEAETAMESVRGEFEKWRLLNANTPEKWESKWTEMMDSTRDSYLKGKELAPAAKDAIAMQWGSYSSRVKTQVGVDSVRRTVAMGAEALEATRLRSVEAGDLNGALAAADEGVRLGVWGPDKAEMMKLQAMDDIEAKQLEDGKNMIDYHLLNGDTQSALDVVSSLPAPDSEKMLLRAKVEKVHAVEVEKGNIMDRLASGEDPQAIKAELEARNDDGTYKHHPYLPPSARAELLDPINRIMLEERSAIVENVTKGIEAGEIDTEEELVALLEPAGADPFTVALLQKKLKGERIDLEEDVVAMQLKAANYDPKTDPDGVIYQSIREQAGIMFGRPRPPLTSDPRRDDVLDMLERRRQGEPLTPGQETKAQIIKQTKDLVEVGGSYKIPSDRIVMVEEEDGTKSYIDIGAKVDPSDPDYYEDKRSFLGRAWETGKPWAGKVTGRRVLLTPEDKAAIDQGKTTLVEDIKLKNRELGKAAPIIDEIEKGLNDGTIKDSTEAKAKYEELLLPVKLDAAHAAISTEPLFAPGQAEAAAAAPKGVTLRPEVMEWLNK